jgi:transposase
MPRGKDLPISTKEHIISMNRIEGLSPKRISQQLHISINTMKTIVRKANKADRDGIVPCHRGKSLKNSSSTDLLIKRLQMENQLLRDFLHLAGRT